MFHFLSLFSPEVTTMDANFNHHACFIFTFHSVSSCIVALCAITKYFAHEFGAYGRELCPWMWFPGGGRTSRTHFSQWHTRGPKLWARWKVFIFPSCSIPWANEIIKCIEWTFSGSTRGKHGRFSFALFHPTSKGCAGLIFHEWTDDTHWERHQRRNFPHPEY